MIIYILIAFLVFLNTVVTKKIYFLIFLILFFVSGFRSELVGVDGEAYKLLFDEGFKFLSTDEILQKVEPLWYLVNVFISRNNLGYQTVVLMSSFLTIYPVYFICKKESVYPSLSIFLYVTLYYYLFPFSLMRQFIAISFFMLGVYYSVKENRKYQVLFFVTAVMFHFSALLAVIVVYLGGKFNFNKKIILPTLILTFLLGFSDFFVFLRVIFDYIPYLKYANYISYNEGAEINKINMYLLLIPQNIMCYYILKKTNKSIYNNIFFIGVVAVNLFLLFPLFSRFGYYFLIFEIILVPNLITEAKNLITRKLMTNLILLYGFIFFVYYIFKNRAGIIPYQAFYEFF